MIGDNSSGQSPIPNLSIFPNMEGRQVANVDYGGDQTALLMDNGSVIVFSGHLGIYIKMPDWKDILSFKCG